MALKDLKDKGGKKTNKGFEPGHGVILEVATAIKNEDDSVKITGKVLNNSGFVKAGEMVTVEADNAAYNMSKGGAKFGKPESTAGTILVLEGCKQKGMDGEERVLSAKYVTTLKSNSKVYNDMDRDFKSVMASAPVIAFKNVAPADGEPKFIKWATNTESIRHSVKNAKGDRQVVEHGRDWLTEKHAAAVAAGEKVHVYMDVVQPERAALVADEQDFYALVKGHSINDRNMVLAVRAYDAKDVMTRKIEQRMKKGADGAYSVDTEALVDSLQKGRIIKSVADNGKLFEAVKAGEINLEVIPGSRMYFPADSALTMVKKNLLSPAKDKDGAVVNTMAFTFGDKAFNYARCLVPGLVTEDKRFMPINLVREEPSKVDLYSMITPATPVAPGTAPAVPAEDDAHIEDPAMDQSLDAAIFDEDLSVHAQSSAPAPGA